MMRSHDAGALRPEHDGTRSPWPAGWRTGAATTAGWSSSTSATAAARPGRLPRGGRGATTCGRSTACWSPAGSACGRRATGNDALPTGEIEVTAAEVGCSRARRRCPSRSPTRAPRRQRGAGCASATSTCAARPPPRAPAGARRITANPPGHGGARLPRRRDPDLTRSTPEGARDFLVPVRLQPGSLVRAAAVPAVQQLLMVGGLERYYQIARCFRDEDFRADRQPEFPQLDVEMSFPDEDDLYALTEEVFRRIWREVLGIDPAPFPRMTYDEAMPRFGSDRPDTRFGVELVDLTSYFASTPFRVFQAAHVGAVVMPGGASTPRKGFDAWQEWASGRCPGLAYVPSPRRQPRRPGRQEPVRVRARGPREAVGAQVGDAAFFAAGSRSDALALLGATRLEIGRRLGLLDDERYEFLWVTDFPMFEPTEDGGWTAVHHPFTAPARAERESFAQDPADVPARAYDLVLNGSELGGGSIRIHSSEVQRRVFDVIGLSPEQAQEKFGFLLEAFSYGPPPHGGIAFGIDRVAAMVTGSESIRDVIAFPKTGGGGDPLTGAPTPITAAQRKEAGIDADPARR